FAAVMSFVDSLDDESRATYVEAARGMRSAVAFTGLVDHAILALLWPLCTASVVPSILPEAFGMVSAEAAACGCPPVVSHHSGLATVADALAGNLPIDLRDLHAFDVHAGDAVQQLADRLVRICQLPPGASTTLLQSGRRTVEDNWSWDSIAHHIAD